MKMFGQNLVYPVAVILLASLTQGSGRKGGDGPHRVTISGIQDVVKSNHDGTGKKRGMFDDLFQQMHSLQADVDKLGIGKLEVIPNETLNLTPAD